MKKLALLLALLLALSTVPVSAASTDTITVYNWGQYISDGTDDYIDVIAAFTEETGIKVNYVTYDSNETLYTKLKTGGTNYDVIIPSDYMIGRMIAEDMLEPLNFDNIPNYQYIDDTFLDASYDPENLYSVPYTWGTVGLIYNTKYVTEAPTSWSALWDDQYEGKILMFDNSRDAFGIAELLNGHSINTTDTAELEAAADLLKDQKSVVQSYVMDQIFDKMQREEAWLAPYYAGDFLLMVEENPDLAFVLPDEGFNMFVDAMCIPKGAENKEGAEAFINFLCDPEICGQNLEWLGYSAPISAAKEFMDPEVAESPVAYPDESVLEHGSSFLNLSTEANQEMEALWLDVKTAGTNTSLYLICGGVAAVLLVIAIILRTKAQKKRKARRGSAK